MFSTTKYGDLPKNCTFIDVRSPSEFAEGSIHGAYNVPLFSDEERSEIGYLYKQKSPSQAKLRGIQLISKNLPSIYEKIMEIKISTGNCIVLFCARGGYRSRSISTLLNSIGDRVFMLENGYKGYRNYILSDLENILKEKIFIVLHGNTGIGKTRILLDLEEKGYDMLDLEGAANHRGSILGGIGKGSCKTQKNFESTVYHKLCNCSSNYIFIEAESRKIGNVFIPEALFLKMKSGIHISLASSLEFRADVILDDYIVDENFENEFIKALSSLEKYIGKSRTENYIEMVKDKKYKEIAMDLMANYYDSLYEHTAKKYDYSYHMDVKSIEEASHELISWFENNISNS